MQQIAHDNHFVPRFYLKQWSNDGIHIWSYRVLVSHEKVPEWSNLPIRGVAYQRDLYTYYVNGEEVDDFEKWLSTEFEEPAQESITKVLKDNSLSALDWKCLAMYLGAQDVRTPLNYLESAERWEKTLPKLLQETLEKSVNKLKKMKNRGESTQHPSTVDNQFFDKAINIQIHPSSGSDSELGYIGAEIVVGRALWLESQKLLLTNTAKALQEHKWSIVYPAKGYQWFTCDHPVVKLNYYGDGKYDLKGGWGNKGANILMPISPRHLLFTQIGDEFPDRFTLTVEQTRKFQGFIAERSFRWIFAHKPLKIISKLRPRYVNAEAYNQETEQWKKWHKEQGQAENKSDVSKVRKLNS
jgi:hypothetical protein